jgi:CheY-like chemotaxis protein
MAELDQLRARFLAEGLEELGDLERRLEGCFDATMASKAAHQWVGTGGLLGFPEISRLAREAEHLMGEQPLDAAELRETLESLRQAFESPRRAGDEPLPAGIAQALETKRVAAVAFRAQEQQRLRAALDRVGAQSVFLDATEAPEAEAALSADILLVHASEETLGTRWLHPAGPLAGRRPVVLTGSRQELAALPQEAQALAREFLMDSWQAEEALVRLSLAAAARPQGRVTSPLNVQMQTRVVIADDDPAVLSLVRTALENFGMECHPAKNGSDALTSVRSLRPHAAVLDVNMPGKDGYEVLAAIRREDLPVRVLLLTARQQESDIVRGFNLGADDYVVKPFSPLELVARLKRLLSR